MPDRKLLDENHASFVVQKQWEDEGRPPLLMLSGSHYERGWDCLEQLGVPHGAWFVCLHVRESGYLNQYGDPYAVQRDADIKTYLLAAKTIVEAGGWVIRMGDPTTKPLPSMYHVIDYAHSEIRSDWMDIFCCAECRFFLGTTSGLYLVSYNFGVPCALTNFIPMATVPLSEKHIYIKKLYWSTTEKRYLTFNEALIPPLDFNDDNNLFKSLNINIVDNTPEEINDLVIEMLYRLNGNLKYTEEEESLQKKYKTLLPYKNGPGYSRVGRAFLRKYARLLLEDDV
jgi:putative glycosyltransferase (TIGR04372 family)